MKGFRFRLGRVLRVRRLEEQMARAAYLERLDAAHQAQDASARGATLARSMESELAARITSGPLDAHAVIFAQRSVDSMASACARHRERARTLERQAEQARAPWSRVRVGVRALEVLEDRMRERFRVEQEKQANKELDETATRRAAGTPRAAAPPRSSPAPPRSPSPLSPLSPLSPKGESK